MGYSKPETATMPHVIQDARVLQDEFLPREVVHRHEQVNSLSNGLEPAIEGDHPEDAILVGPSGAGKTCIARYTVDKLKEQALDVTTQYVECWQNSSRFRVLLKLLEGIGSTHDIHQTTSREMMLDRLRSEVPKRYIVILDEVDLLQDMSLLRELYEIPELSMILIANDEDDIFGTVNERLQSRLRSSQRIRFDSYTGDELVSILEDRAEWGLAPDAVSQEQLREVADIAAGNARDAISILRLAAKKAEREGVETIQDGFVREAIPEARKQYHEQTLDKLNEDQQVIYDILIEKGELSPGDVYERYSKQVEDPKTKRTIRNYLQKLERYSLVKGAGSGPARTYSAIEFEG